MLCKRMTSSLVEKTFFLIHYIWGRVKIVQLGIINMAVMTCDSQKLISALFVLARRRQILNVMTNSVSFQVKRKHNVSLARKKLRVLL